ncbi:hypothetical protein PTKIN_Ptkin06aG0046300 [Pterospermum kingtungense]
MSQSHLIPFTDMAKISLSSSIFQGLCSIQCLALLSYKVLDRVKSDSELVLALDVPVEGVSSGLPMITWPMFAEQFYNEKFIVQVLKIGVRIGVKAYMKAGVLMVKMEDVKKAVKQLVGGDEGEERRRKAKKLGDMAKRAVQNGGSSHLNVTLLIEYVNQQCLKKQFM